MLYQIRKYEEWVTDAKKFVERDPDSYNKPILALCSITQFL